MVVGCVQEGGICADDGLARYIQTNKGPAHPRSLTSVFLPPLKRVQSYESDVAKKSVAAEDDVVILVCGSAPAKLLKIDSSSGGSNLVATVSCEIQVRPSEGWSESTAKAVYRLPT